MEKAEIEIAYALASRVISKRNAPVGAALAVLQDAWGAPTVRFTKADDEIDRAVAGAHGIEALARQEKSFYNALTEGQREAYQAIMEIVESLYKQGKGWTGFDPWAIGEPIDEWKRKAFVSLATHPMQSFLVGQTLANEAMGSALARPLYPTDKAAIEFLEHSTFNEIDSAFENLKGILRASLINGMQDGDNPKEIARKLANDLKDHQTDWALVTITETSRADATGRLHEVADAGFKEVIGSSAHDPKTCDSCKELLDGKVCRVDDVLGASNRGRKKADWIPCIPLHPRCRCVWLPYTAETEEIIRGE
jgi:SPP1 gp7 family putative phage head morphogenesis protein